eukprot:1957312-Pyramimonas_sp.AAC.1
MFQLSIEECSLDNPQEIRNAAIALENCLLTRGTSDRTVHHFRATAPMKVPGVKTTGAQVLSPSQNSPTMSSTILATRE